MTLGFLLISLLGHWVFGWFAYADEQQLHDVPPDVGGFVIEMLRDTFENWQSEFPATALAGRGAHHPALCRLSTKQGK